MMVMNILKAQSSNNRWILFSDVLSSSLIV